MSLRHGTSLALLGAILLVVLLGAASFRTGDSGAAVLVANTGAQSFVDRTGDAVAGGTDITNVNVSNDDAGKVHFSIEIPTAEQMPPKSFVRINIDSDKNAGTGNSEGADYLLFHEQGFAIGLYRWTGTWTSVPESSLRGTYLRGETVDVNRSALGGTSSFNFWINTVSPGQTQLWDTAPDSGRWTYDVLIGPPKPTGIEASDYTTTPDRPRAGKSFVLRAKFVATNTRQPVTGGNVSCTASVGARALQGVGRFLAGSGICTWTLPASAAGKALKARVTLVFEGLSAWAQVTDTVVGAPRPAKLEIVGFNPSPSTPVAGRRFYGAVGVAIRREGQQAKRITSGTVTCRATVNGTVLHVTQSTVQSGGAICGWDVPSSARGGTLYGSFKVRSQGLVATKGFKLPVR